MKLVLSLSALLMLAVPATAQLASSHASTATAPSAQQKMPPAEMVKFTVADKPVVVVNGVTLTDRDLVREEYAIFPYARQHGGLPKSMAGQIRQGAMDMIVFEQLVYEEGVRRGIVIPAAKIDAAEAAFKAQFPSAADFKNYIKLECKGSQAVLRQHIRRSMIIEKVMRAETSKAAVTQAEAKSYFDKTPERFRVPDSFAFQSISILPPENATPAQSADTKKRAEEAYKRAKATKNYEEFGMLAEKISEDDFRVDMGDHKNVPTEKLPAEVKKLAASLKPGQMSDLVNLGGAYTIMRLNAFVPARQLKFDDVKTQLLKDMQKQKLDQARSEFGKRLRKNAKIQML